MITCDALVLGVGGVGSAALMHLARRGVHAIGIDQFTPPHSRGSSHGQTRAIRQAYFEHPDYVPLLRRAYTLWDELEAESGRSLFHRVGLLEAGPMDGIVVPGVLESAATHQLPVQRWTVDEARERVPGLRLDESFEVVFEENAGFLLVESCVDAHCEVAKRCGAEIRVETVQQWRRLDHTVKVETTEETYHAKSLVITGGAWASPLLRTAGVELPLRVVRKHLHWYPTTDERYEFKANVGFPVFFVEEHVDPTDESGMHRFFYGFPKLDSRGVKVAEHSDATDAGDPLLDPRDPEPDDQRRVAAFVTKRLTNVSSQAADHAVCFYTLTPDHHFIVDSLSPQLAIAAGLSGHGFKFTTVLGELLAQMVCSETPRCPIDFLKLSRFDRVT